MTEEEAVERARKNLWANSKIQVGDKTLVVACLIRPEDTRPLHVPWWRGKEVYLIGADIDGNFFLRHCDGTARHWDHSKQEDEVIAQSVREFPTSLQPAGLNL